MHSVHEIGAVEREGMRRSDKVPTEEDSYGVEEVKYMNEPRSYHFKPNPNLPTHYNPTLRNHENFSYGGGTSQVSGQESSSELEKIPLYGKRRNCPRAQDFYSRAGLDKAKVSIIKSLMPPTTVKGIRSFLGHAGFYRRFIRLIQGC